MTSIATENLEERIERIRKRTEEIEKKHRAAEEDRLMALMDNAMVKTKPPNDEDWPKAHKYDKLDFTYDIKPEKLDENIEQLKQQLLKPKRDYKKFADGEGPPPDPIYNFLADAERDGIVLQQKEQQQQKNNDKKDSKQQNNLNNIVGNNSKNIDSNNKNKDLFSKRGGGQQNNNFRNRGSGGVSDVGKNGGKNSQPEQWRSEKNDDNNKINNRQKSNNISNNWRGNIMVSVSPGEVKSVKLTSAQVIGSGRVGPRQLSKPQFHIQTMEKEQHDMTPNNIISNSPRQQFNSGHQQQLNKLDNFNNQQHNNNHNNYQQFATKKSIPPTHRQQQTTIIQPQQLNINNTNNGISLAPKSPIKDKRNIKSLKYTPPQQQKPILPNLMSINGGRNAGDNILTSPTITNPIIVNNVVNNLLKATSNNVVKNSGTITNVDINVPEIDDKVLAVAKTLTNKPEFAKKSVQDRLIRIRQLSQPDVVATSSALPVGTNCEAASNNNNIVDQLVNINNNNLNATLLIKDASKDEQNDSIKNIETIVACN